MRERGNEKGREDEGMMGGGGARGEGAGGEGRESQRERHPQDISCLRSLRPLRNVEPSLCPLPWLAVGHPALPNPSCPRINEESKRTFETGKERASAAKSPEDALGERQRIGSA